MDDFDLQYVEDGFYAGTIDKKALKSLVKRATKKPHKFRSKDNKELLALCKSLLTEAKGKPHDTTYIFDWGNFYLWTTQATILFPKTKYLTGYI